MLMFKAKNARNEQPTDQEPMWHHNFDSRPPLFKRMSSEYIVDLSSRSLDSLDH